jgi:drug/metabolite transporter (DMT)-like permease
VTRPSFAPVRRRDVGVLSAVGVADNAANVLFALATAKGLFTLVSVIASLVPVVTVLLARVVLHEHLTRHQLVGVVLALGGVVTIAAG